MDCRIFEFIFSGIGGAIVGAWIAYLFAIRLSAKQESSVAAARFRAAFAPLISQMELAQENASIDKRAILDDTFKDISVAIELFRPYVERCKQEAYQKAWKDYYSTGLGGRIHFAQYTFKTEENGVKKDPYKLFTERINNVLAFAPIP